MEAEGTSGAGEILEVLEVWPPDHCLEDQAEAGTEAGTVEETVEDVVGAGVVEDSSYMAFDIKICYECSEHILSIKNCISDINTNYVFLLNFVSTVRCLVQTHEPSEKLFDIY